MGEEKKEIRYCSNISAKEAMQMFVWLQKIVNPHVRYNKDIEVMKDELIDTSHWAGFYLEEFLKKVFHWDE